MRSGFSRSASGTMESFIMGLVDVAARPGMISFATGLPDNSLFDVDGIAKAAEEVLKESGGSVLQYDSATGFVPLRRRIAERCRKELGFSAGYEDVILTNGSQECFDLLARMFLDRGDRMVVENPGYLGAIQSFSAVLDSVTMTMKVSSKEEMANAVQELRNFDSVDDVTVAGATDMTDADGVPSVTFTITCIYSTGSAEQ